MSSIASLAGLIAQQSMAQQYAAENGLFYNRPAEMPGMQNNQMNQMNQGSQLSTYRNRQFLDQRQTDIEKMGIKNKQEKRVIMKMMREYMEKHKDAIFTVGLVMLVDHFIFGGAFREKIKSTVEALLEKAQKQLAKHE